MYKWIIFLKDPSTPSKLDDYYVHSMIILLRGSADQANSISWANTTLPPLAFLSDRTLAFLSAAAMLNRLAFFSRKAFEVSALVLRLPQTPLSLLSFLPTSPTLLPALTFLLLLSASETTLGFLSVTASSSPWSSLLFPSVAAYRSRNRQAIMRLQSSFNHFQITDKKVRNINPKQTCTTVFMHASGPPKRPIT